MVKWRTYWSRSPVRDEIWVEKAYRHALHRPVRDGIPIEKYFVPNGTIGLAYVSVFYRYRIPNGMTKPIRLL